MYLRRGASSIWGDIDFEPHIPTVVLHPSLRRALGIDECTYRGKVSLSLRHSLFLIPWTLQVAKSYGGILAARIFVGVPEVSLSSINTYAVSLCKPAE